ncbi:MAG: CHAD domain-containing protein, partial [Alphaproteobacteria bacterium]|jgi:CHAD domain-containing protein|nr:CHAD domain-containing protein [Alphaproteobacteria bacterium]
LLKLVRPTFDDYKSENKAFRDAARQLSGLRDAASMLETYDALMSAVADTTDRTAFAPIRAGLLRDAQAACRDADAPVRMETARRALDAAGKRTDRWMLRKTGFDALAGGLRSSYARARRAMDAAWAEPDDAKLHAWRKRVKDHWYHTRLLRDLNPSMLDPHEAAADRLADMLGDHHDLAVLEAHLSHASSGFAPTADLDAFLTCLRQRKRTLNTGAFELGRLFLSERDKALAKRWRKYWSTWRAGKMHGHRLLVKA